MAWAARHPYLVPQLLVAAGFWLSAHTDTVWVLIAGGLSAVLTEAAIVLLRRAHGGETPRAALAVLLATAALAQFGALLLVRLVVVPDPADPFGSGLRAQERGEGLSVLVFPLLLFALVLGAGHLLAAPRSGRTGRVGRWLRSWRNAAEPAVAPAAIGLSTAVMVLLFLLPLFGPSTGEARLTFLGVATPEYGKLFFLLSLAAVVGRYSHRFFVTPPAGISAGRRLGRVARLRAQVHATRHVLYPLGLFAVVAVLSGLRNDFGTLIPVLAAMVGVTWATTRHGALVAAGSHEHGPGLDLRGIVRVIPRYRLFAWSLVVLGFAGAALVIASGYVAKRVRVWADPWAHRWDSSCVPVDNPPKTFSGVSLCQESMLANQEAARSQVAKSLAAVADGGLWGRGLGDHMSAVVPGQATDFVLAAVWNKLGGLVVLAVAVLTVLLCAALRRVAAPGLRTVRPRLSALLAIGLAAMIIGQFFFVLAATLNLIPHSGIPVPFLSRGGHSTLALLLAITLALAMTPRTVGTWQPDTLRSAQRAQPAPGPATRRSGWTVGHLRSGVLAGFAACLALVTLATLVPYPAPLTPLPAAYAADRPPCELRQATRDGVLSPAPDPRTCSTDRIAYRRTVVEVRLGGRPVLRQDRDRGGWAPVGSWEGGLTMRDLTGLLAVPGGGLGVVDQSFPAVTNGTAGTSLGRRLAPPRDPADVPPDGVIDLTVDPALQHAMATAMSTPGPAGTTPLAGGMVVLDAVTGQVLAGVSVPLQPTPRPPAATGDLTEVDKYLTGRRRYDHIGPDGRLDGAVGAADCDPDEADGRTLSSCWRWSYTPRPEAADQPDPELLAYLAGKRLPAEFVPQPSVNRAFGKHYGFGSTFKAVIAAEYLSSGGRPDSLIPAPVAVPLSDTVTIRNASDDNCAGGYFDTEITLQRALTVSCNTAFVRLAERIGWPAIAARAELFGLRVGACAKRTDWLAPAMVGAADSCVPAEVDGVAIGNATLGGGQVNGTPLAMASVMATIANGGVAVEPSLVRSLRTPATGAVTTPTPDRVTAVTPTVAAALAESISEVATTGTAAGLDTAGLPVWVKTGTHEVIPPGRFVRDQSWVAGYVETRRGPVAFAVVLEAPDDRTGGRRARHLVEQLAAALRKAS
ncbi:Cell cycle protein [Micromonospora pallida]|uniref:Cell cycle protein n=1 Tax=Micromonospora pallida TaxID=145854 RepID=A0A1C6SYA7_9ACTN|nr:penicillin-binding transpeptidase domain-containing protein [Micromonospora pallida]SCL34507.1 Cell cycle protein [Micromonospora pallida]